MKLDNEFKERTIDNKVKESSLTLQNPYIVTGKQGRLKSKRIGRPILITESNLKEFLQATN